jgi:hypothetical protein
LPPSETKIAVQRVARGFETVVNAHDTDRQHDNFSEEFAERDNDLQPLLAQTERAELIGTVATRTLLRLELSDGETNVVELLWRDYDGTWMIHDCRVFSLIAGV